jgi:probable F420-dependent oxidoreductase
VKFALMLPVSGAFASAEAIRAVAQRAEALGLDAVAVHDHLNWDLRDRYHFMAGNAEAVEAALERGERVDHFYEHVATFAYLAGATTRLKFFSAATVLPWRHPVLLAKQAATLQALSGGRLILGVCIGNVRGDFEMSGAPFRERGAMTEEYLELIARILGPEEQVSRQGRYVSMEQGVFFPKPEPPIPLVYAGESEAALRRAARWCDGWLPLGSPEFVGERITRLKQQLEANGRADATPGYTFSFLTKICLGASDREARLRAAHTIERQVGIEEVKRHPTLADAYIVGSSASVVARLREYQRVGVNSCVFALISPTLEATLEDLERFAAEVMPELAGGSN